MKKSALYILAILFALSSCSKKEDKVEYFEEYGIMVPYRDVSKSATYHLLEVLIDHIKNNNVNIAYLPGFIPSVTKFNQYLWNNKEAAAFLERKDCASVLISTYFNCMKKPNKCIKLDSTGMWKCEDEDIFFWFLSYFMTSEICMSKMNLTEKVHLMALTLESTKYEFMTSPFNNNIMISIMLSSNYTPFVEDIKPKLRQAIGGVSYWVEMGGDYYQQDALIKKYAKQFINDNKK